MDKRGWCRFIVCPDIESDLQEGRERNVKGCVVTAGLGIFRDIWLRCLCLSFSPFVAIFIIFESFILNTERAWIIVKTIHKIVTNQLGSQNVSTEDVEMYSVDFCLPIHFHHSLKKWTIDRAPVLPHSADYVKEDHRFENLVSLFKLGVGLGVNSSCRQESIQP